MFTNSDEFARKLKLECVCVIGTCNVVQCRWPVASIFGRELPLPLQLGGVELKADNSTLDRIRSVFLRYALHANNSVAYKLARSFERSLMDYVSSFSNNDTMRVRAAMQSYPLLMEEVSGCVASTSIAYYTRRFNKTLCSHYVSCLCH